MANLRLLGSRILVRPIPKPTMTSGGIVLLEHYDEHREKMWEVVQVGPKAKEVQAGDRVLTHDFPSNLNVWNDGYRILCEDDVLMKWGFNFDTDTETGRTYQRLGYPKL